MYKNGLGNDSDLKFPLFYLANEEIQRGKTIFFKIVGLVIYLDHVLGHSKNGHGKMTVLTSIPAELWLYVRLLSKLNAKYFNIDLSMLRTMKYKKE